MQDGDMMDFHDRSKGQTSTLVVLILLVGGSYPIHYSIPTLVHCVLQALFLLHAPSNSCPMILTDSFLLEELLGMIMVLLK